MSYNRSFDLDLQELELIEESLRNKLRNLANNRLTHVQSTVKHESELPSVARIDDEIKEINKLLGKLHNQKIWYRPKDKTYISG